MKVPLKNRKISVIADSSQHDPYSYIGEIKTYDYAHEDPLFGEIAGHVFNRYLSFRKEKDGQGERFQVRFGSSNPTKARLHVVQIIDAVEEHQSRGKVREYVYENICEELLYKAFEAIDTVHKMDNSFFERIKYVFKKGA